jgi:hypothetical protein
MKKIFKFEKETVPNEIPNDTTDLIERFDKFYLD